MKKVISIKFMLPLVAGMLLLASCKKTEYILFDKNFAGVYFQNDSIYYSFGVTPLSRTSYQLKVPVTIMGEPAKADRHFEVTVDKNKSTAIEGVHYSMENDLVIKADSIHGYVAVTILRSELGNDNFKIYLKLKETPEFSPVNEKYKEVLIHFNNKVERPNWKDWWGDPAWPSYRLGAWNPLTYIKFIELFREMEHKAPETYNDMVAQFGEDLVNGPEWAWDYDYSLTKYVLIPLYQYFMEQHPEMGVTIPRPAGY